MNILSIETSCDETGVAILTANTHTENDMVHQSFSILAHALISQADLHAQYGGVYPSLAKREHARTLVPLAIQALKDASFYAEYKNEEKNVLSDAIMHELRELLTREPALLEASLTFFTTCKKPNVDVIAVTEGPGLEPALWVGINFARALSLVWGIPIIPVNHMEGHILSSLVQEQTTLGAVHFPALALLISGGHTELVLIKKWMDYELVGSTRDDAVGEAFDKAARMLGLTYPGGPEISKLAAIARAKNMTPRFSLPRPMIGSDDCDFSFSGLKTAVLYALRDIDPLTDDIKQEFAQEFEEAVTEILIKKTKKAMDVHGVQTLILGGGVSANTYIREAFTTLFKQQYPNKLLYLPEQKLTTDNAVMIALAGLMRVGTEGAYREPRAQGNLRLALST